MFLLVSRIVRSVLCCMFKLRWVAYIPYDMLYFVFAANTKRQTSWRRWWHLIDNFLLFVVYTCDFFPTNSEREREGDKKSKRSHSIVESHVNTCLKSINWTLKIVRLFSGFVLGFCACIKTITQEGRVKKGGKNSVVTLDPLKVKVQCIEYLFYNNTSMYLQVCACLGPDINTTLFSVRIQ